MLVQNCLKALAMGAAITTIFSHTVAAGGFSKTTGFGSYGAAHSETNVAATSKYFDYKSKTSASGRSDSLFDGKILEAGATAKNVTSFTGKGNVTYKQWKAAKSKVYAKGGNVMAKSRAENYVTIHVSGKSYVVSREIARSMARFTPLGTTAAADSASHVSVVSNGYVGTTTGTSAKASVRVAN